MAQENNTQANAEASCLMDTVNIMKNYNSCGGFLKHGCGHDTFPL